MITEVVGERSRQRGSHTVRSGGASGSENAGVSSEMQVRILHTDRPRFPGEGSSALGKSGPNARPKGVVDGKQAKDSCTRIWSEGVTETDSVTLLMD